jgi:hypothetical protein
VRGRRGDCRSGRYVFPHLSSISKKVEAKEPEAREGRRDIEANMGSLIRNGFD